ncbi:MAG TPA: alcohol dehydrogenase catalytic domain-containing protein [Syntrophomonas sp.]|nr:alcohol dehydrogenase catalytic domain-containing protein [Syntrophomonas sp.]
MEQKTMMALRYHEPGQYSLDEAPVPKLINPTDAIARVTLSTICTSDVHMVHGHIPTVNEAIKAAGPRIVGHEFCAEVVQVGEAVRNFKAGDRVHVKAGIECHECAMCKLGMPTFCAQGGVFGTSRYDGCQAEYVRIPFADATMIHIPQGLTEEDVLLLSDMLGTAWFGIKNAGLSPGQSVAVIGVGPVGQSVCLLASKVFGAKQVIAVDLIESRVNAALQAGVADIGIVAGKEDVAAKIAAATGGVGVDATIETAGNQEAMNTAFAATRINGVVSTVSVFAQPLTVPFNQIVYKNLSIKMGIQKLEGVEELLALLQKGIIDTKYILTHRAPLNDIMKGYEVFGNHEDGCIKWVVTPYER